jgi:hypothetical protein
VSGAGNERYLGLLFLTEDYKVYAYVTNTRIKFVLIVDDACTAKDTEIRQVILIQQSHSEGRDTLSLSLTVFVHLNVWM